jgi:activating signal cointegrator 1
MKALTLHQPYASLIAIGAKQIETRSWATSYRGPLAIHAARTLHRARALCQVEPYRAVLAAAGYSEPETLPVGAVVATCRLVACLPMGDARTFPLTGVPLPGSPEHAFGEYKPGRYMWLLADVEPLAVPVSARGWQGLWEWRP